MSPSGPPLERLLHRLADCPPEFLLPPSEIEVVALVCDHWRALGLAIPDEAHLGALRKSPEEQLRFTALVIWVLRDEWFLNRPDLAEALWRLLTSASFAKLAHLVRAEACVADPDRREELVRLCLRGLDVLPAGETAAQAADRFTSLDSVERDRVIRQTRAAEARAREIREAMARKRAEEAAARYSPE